MDGERFSDCVKKQTAVHFYSVFWGTLVYLMKTGFLEVSGLVWLKESLVWLLCAFHLDKCKWCHMNVTASNLPSEAQQKKVALGPCSTQL